MTFSVRRAAIINGSSPHHGLRSAWARQPKERNDHAQPPALVLFPLLRRAATIDNQHCAYNVLAHILYRFQMFFVDISMNLNRKLNVALPAQGAIDSAGNDSLQTRQDR